MVAGNGRVRASDGVLLYAEAHGEGIPLVLSCALCTTHENWRAQVEPFVDAGARVILWDYRGHGRSESPADPLRYSMNQVVDDLRAVLDWAAPDEPAVLAGLSFGGLCSLHLALRAPDRARALVLIDSGPGFKKPAALEGWQEAVDRTARFIEKRGLRAFVDGRAGASCVGRYPERPAARAAADAIADQNPTGVAHFARRVAGLAPPVIDELSTIGVPALVIVGEQDQAYLRAAEVMAARLPGAVKVTLPDAGHIVNIEAPEGFNAVVIEFLRGIGG